MIEGDALEIDAPALFDGRAAYRRQSALQCRHRAAGALAVGRLAAVVATLTLMFQREVAERIVAAPGSDAYGRLAVLAQWRSDARGSR